MLKTIEGKLINIEKSKSIFLTTTSYMTIEANGYIPFPYKYHDDKNDFTIINEGKSIMVNRDMLTTVSMNIWGKPITDGRVWLFLLLNGKVNASIIQYGSYNTLTNAPIIMDLKKGDVISVSARESFNLNTGSNFYSYITVTEI